MDQRWTLTETVEQGFLLKEYRFHEDNRTVILCLLDSRREPDLNALECVHDMTNSQSISIANRYKERTLSKEVIFSYETDDETWTAIA